MRKKCKMNAGKFFSMISIVHGINSYSAWLKDKKTSKKTLHEPIFLEVLPDYKVEVACLIIHPTHSRHSRHRRQKVWTRNMRFL